MTQDEIIHMAREAGFNESGCAGIIGVEDFLERFAALVAEPWIETNKALAKEIIEREKQVDISALPIIIEAAVKEAVLAERDACAKLCEEVKQSFNKRRRYDEAYGAEDCAAAVRARSNHG